MVPNNSISRFFLVPRSCRRLLVDQISRLPSRPLFPQFPLPFVELLQLSVLHALDPVSERAKAGRKCRIRPEVVGLEKGPHLDAELPPSHGEAWCVPPSRQRHSVSNRAAIESNGEIRGEKGRKGPWGRYRNSSRIRLCRPLCGWQNRDCGDWFVGCSYRSWTTLSGQVVERLTIREAGDGGVVVDLMLNWM